MVSLVTSPGYSTINNFSQSLSKNSKEHLVVFCETSVALISKPKMSHGKKLHTNAAYEYS